MGWLRNWKLGEIKAKYEAKYILFLSASRWAARFADLVKYNSTGWGHRTAVASVDLAMTLKIDDPLAWFDKSLKTRIQNLKQYEQEQLRKMIFNELHTKGTASISDTARRFPAYCGAALISLPDDAFATTPEEVMRKYDEICQGKF